MPTTCGTKQKVLSEVLEAVSKMKKKAADGSPLSPSSPSTPAMNNGKKTPKMSFRSVTMPEMEVW